MSAPESSASIKAPSIESWSENRISSGRSNKAVGTAVLANKEQGLPRAVTNLGASAASKVIGGAMYRSVQITHQISSQDQAFHHANVWVTGLNGNPNPQLQSASTKSPHNLLIPATGEQVSITVQSVGKDGSLLPLAQSPSTPVQL